MTTQITLETLETATTKELLAFYNAHNVDAPVAKFADLKTARRRCKAILESLAIIAEQGGDIETGAIVEPKAIVHKTRESRAVNPGAMLTDINAAMAEEDITEEDARRELELLKLNKEESAKKIGAKSGLTLSQAISQSWADPLVAQKRMTRHSVAVSINGKVGEFKSCGAAFEALKLPMTKCIRFRMTLKAHGAAIFEHNGESYHFSISAATEAE